MNEPWTRYIVQERAAALQREAADERLARDAKGGSGDRARATSLLSIRLVGRLWLRVELWPR